MKRLLRTDGAHEYLSMGRDLFDREVRPHLTEILIGTQGLFYDVRELDKWVDSTMAGIRQEGAKCENGQEVSRSAALFGTSTASASKGTERYTKARAKVISHKRKSTEIIA